MKFATLIALALSFAGLAVAQNDPLNPEPVPKAPDCACGPDCPCKAACAAAMAKVQAAEPPVATGHYAQVCDGRRCRVMWVPDTPSAQAPVTYYQAPSRTYYAAPKVTYYSSPVVTYSTYSVSEGEEVVYTAPRRRGPIRRLLFGR